MLKRIRVVLAALFWVAITMLFLDFTGVLRHYLGWLAKIQFLPAVLAVNVGVIVALVLLTLVFGRIYCSVICPMGVLQDVISWVHGKTKKKNRFRFSFKKENVWLRYGVLVVFIALIVAGVASIAYIIAPYGAYGRIVSNLRFDIPHSLPTVIVSVVLLVVIVVLAWIDGRAWCNNICPVGTVLGTISRFSIFAPKINTDKCVNCGLCGKQCKASCIDTKNHRVDTSRCVDCFDCIGACKHGAISFGPRNPFDACAAVTPNDASAATEPAARGNGRLRPAADSGVAENNSTNVNESAAETEERKKAEGVDEGKRAFITVGAIVAGTALMKAQEFGGDGGLAPIEAKKVPERETPIVPPGAVGLKHLATKCIGCQLCVTKCPNGVLRPSTEMGRLMQPEMGFEDGFCRPECTRCSEVCPTGAILEITREEKTAIHVGHAEVDTWMCIASSGEKCGNCARHCPVGAIRMVENEFDPEGPRVPFVNKERCIGCGACEYLCPVRPLSAIHVEGNEVHHDERKEVEPAAKEE